VPAAGGGIGAFVLTAGHCTNGCWYESPKRGAVGTGAASEVLGLRKPEKLYKGCMRATEEEEAEVRRSENCAPGGAENGRTCCTSMGSPSEGIDESVDLVDPKDIEFWGVEPKDICGVESVEPKDIWGEERAEGIDIGWSNVSAGRGCI